MVNYTILAGGFAHFVISYLFNSQVGTLTIQANSTTGDQPSWLALHPTNKTLVYTTNAIKDNSAALQSLAIGPKGALTVLETVSSGGIGPVFTSPLSTGQVAVMNYDSGSGRIIPTSATDPAHFDDSAPRITFPIPPSGQSHAHAAYEFGKEVFVPDFGADKIYRLAEDGSPGKWKITGSIDQEAGSGPRHLVIKDNKVFTIHETANTLTIQTIPASPDGVASLLASVSVAPTDNVPAGAIFAAAEVLYPPPLIPCDGEVATEPSKPYIYASNRNNGVADPRGDTIAIFEHISPGVAGKNVGQRGHKRNGKDELKLVNQVYTGLQQIRSMAFSDDGQYLVAGGQKSGGVKVYKRTDGGRSLVEVASNSEVDTRTNFVWIC